MPSPRELDRITIDLGGAKVLDIDTFLQRKAETGAITEEQLAARQARLKAARLMTKAGLLDDTPRIYGATADEELMIFPHFKPRTIKPMSVAQQTAHDLSILEGTFDKRNSDIQRTLRGKLLTRIDADEIPVNYWIGVHNLFGNGRPPLVPEFFSEMYEKFAADFNMTPMESLQKLQVGFFTVSACFGARIMDEQGRPRYMEAVQLAEEAWPPKIDMIKATFSEEFLSQKGNSGSEQSLQSNVPIIVG